MPISPVFGYYETQSIRPTLQLQEKTVVTQACALCQPSKGRAKDCLGKKRWGGGWSNRSIPLEPYRENGTHASVTRLALKLPSHTFSSYCDCNGTL